MAARYDDALLFYSRPAAGLQLLAGDSAPARTAADSPDLARRQALEDLSRQVGLFEAELLHQRCGSPARRGARPRRAARRPQSARSAAQTYRRVYGETFRLEPGAAPTWRRVEAATPAPARPGSSALPLTSPAEPAQGWGAPDEPEEPRPEEPEQPEQRAQRAQLVQPV